MKKKIVYISVMGLAMSISSGYAQDWAAYEVPADAGEGKTWALQEAVSDDFNYTSDAATKSEEFTAKWDDYFHNSWTGPAPTLWRRDHSCVADGKLQMKASRVNDEEVTFTSNNKSYTLPATRLGCITSKVRVSYPAYVETYVKITNSVLASDVWMLSADDTQEIDICEAYGSSRYTNDWFSNKRLHLSHHVFIRNPFTDWQPSDEGSFYTDGSTLWSNDYHRIGVYWRDPWHLEYYVDGELVRTRSGKAQIDPQYHTNASKPGDSSEDTRTGLSKDMDIIINTEDQTWRAIQGLSPTARELSIEDDVTFKVDWIRVYKPQEITNAMKDIDTKQTQIYPNPVKGNLHIKAEKVIEKIEIFDLQGRPLLSQDCHKKQATYDSSSLSCGTYIICLTYEDHKRELKEIIKS